MPLHPLLKICIEKGSIIEDSWKGFAHKVIPEIDKHQTQYTEMRKAYYCGFYAAFSLMIEVSSEVSEDQADKILTNIKENCEREIKKFAKWESIK